MKKTSTLLPLLFVLLAAASAFAADPPVRQGFILDDVPPWAVIDVENEVFETSVLRYAFGLTHPWNFNIYGMDEFLHKEIGENYAGTVLNSIGLGYALYSDVPWAVTNVECAGSVCEMTVSTERNTYINRIYEDSKVLEFEYTSQSALWQEDWMTVAGPTNSIAFVMYGMDDIVGFSRGQELWQESEDLAEIIYNNHHNHGDTFIMANGSTVEACTYNGYFLYGMINLDTGEGIGHVFDPGMGMFYSGIPAHEWKVWWNGSNDIALEFFPGGHTGKRWMFPVEGGRDEIISIGMDIVDFGVQPPECTDADGDGYGRPASSTCPFSQRDCDDFDPAVNPGAEEDCDNGIDDDCDGDVDAYDPDCPLICTDDDGDGFSIEGGPCGPVDCDDSETAVNPGATEGLHGDPTCADGLDNDCDGSVDGEDLGCIYSDALYRLNCGSDTEYIDGQGNTWLADIHFSGGDMAIWPGEIAGTDDDTIYQTERWGSFSYAFPDIIEEAVVVILHFAEIYFVDESICSGSCEGKRVFDVTIEGSLVVDDLDIVAQTGPLTALVLPFDEGVTDGELNIGFLVGSADNPKISGIEVLRTGDCTDNDGDGYAVEGGECGPVDCDDSDPAVNPGAAEDCENGIDDDCDGDIDGDDTDCLVPCTDADLDGYAVEGGECGPVDCDDSDLAVHPGADEGCNGLDNDCDGVPGADEADSDEDDWMICAGDCDDGDAGVNPDQEEVPGNGIDDDCDGEIDEGGFCFIRAVMPTG